MTRVVDVVNFNADASCLRAQEWLRILEGGADSSLCQWLGTYVARQKRVVLGFVGAAVADIRMANPEALALINAHPQVFEAVIRPFAHDIGLLRSSAGFATNLSLGMATVTREFDRVVNFFLPPEFMLTSGQVRQLSEAGVDGVFINSARFKDELSGRIPERPYLLHGAMGSQLKCIPFSGALTEAYLQSIHSYDGSFWTRAIASAGPDGLAFVWRDGESSFLLPDSVAREAAWLDGESGSIERRFLSEQLDELAFSGKEGDGNAFRSYPTHSFSAWFKENRMLGFLGRVERIEHRLGEMSVDARAIWLQAINSDILSAVEKDSPTISLSYPGDSGRGTESFTIWRADRGFEGEDFLERLERLMEQGDYQFAADAAERPHIRKLQLRATYLRSLADGSR